MAIVSGKLQPSLPSGILPTELEIPLNKCFDRNPSQRPNANALLNELSRFV